MRVRFYVDSRTGLPHIYNHDVTEDETEQVISRPGEDRPARDGARCATGQTDSGRYLRVIYLADAGPDSVFPHGLPVGGESPCSVQAPRPQEVNMAENRFPPGWDEERVERVIAHYETQSDDEAVAEDEAVREDRSQTLMEVPVELVPAVRELIAKHTK